MYVCMYYMLIICMATVGRDGDGGDGYGRYDRRRHGDEDQTVLDHEVSSVTSQDQGNRPYSSFSFSSSNY